MEGEGMIEYEVDVKKRFFDDPEFLNEQIIYAISTRPKKVRNIISTFEKKQRIDLDGHERKRLSALIILNLKIMVSKGIVEKDKERYKISPFYKKF